MRLLPLIVTFYFILSGWVSLAQTVEIPDPAFRACLLEKNPSILDANQDMIISEANATTGFLSCIGKDITNVEGLQYLTAINDLNLSGNQITQISAFPLNSNLTRLVLNDNQLESLPELISLPSLKIFEIKRNLLTSLPDLSGNPNITQLYVQSNQLSFIPDLRNQTELWAVNFSGNNLTSLPFLDSLKKLEELVVADNRLTQLPSLEKLDSLKLLDISENQIDQLPDFAPGNAIETIDIEKNNFRTLPDFSIFPSLNKAFLDNNYFTFEDLLPLTAISGYESIFPLSSQKPVVVGQEISIAEKEAYFISTGTDLSISGIERTWYFEGNEVQRSTEDSLKVFADSTSLSGNYYATLSFSAFPGLLLRTDSFQITVTPCFDVSGYVVEISPRSCNSNGGKVKVVTSSSIPQDFVYQLISPNGAEVYTSSEGTFANLGSKAYALYGVLGDCKKLIEPSITLENQDCDNVYITADGDGVNDVYFFNEQGKVTISDKFGNTVSELQAPGQWGGFGNKGKVAPGLYFANINDGEKLIKITVVY